jgi:hypothetical protein
LNNRRLIYLLLVASLFAFVLACVGFSGLDGMSDGGGLL